MVVGPYIDRIKKKKERLLLKKHCSMLSALWPFPFCYCYTTHFWLSFSL